MDTLIKFFLDHLDSLLINLIAGAIIGLLGWYLRRLSQRSKFIVPIVILIMIVVSAIALYLIVRITTRSKKAEVVFSDFNDGYPRNYYKVRWGVLNDNESKGNSNVTIEIQPSPTAQTPVDYYGVLSYSLGKNSSTPYCGIFSWFAREPIDTRDISVYGGVQLEAWPEGDFPEGVRVYLQISPYELIKYKDGFLEYEFTKDLKKNTGRSEILFPFSKFKISRHFEALDMVLPEAPEKGLSKEFQKQIYQVSIIIEGNSGTTGKIDFDNLKFYY